MTATAGTADDATLSTGQVAELCGVSKSTVRRAAMAGQLKAWHTPGHHLRFQRSACDEFMRSLGRIEANGA
jgi:excisionase family DNA binding protein